MTTIRAVYGHLVQTSPDFSTWTTRDRIICSECSEGAGQVVGSASMYAPFGTIRQPGSSGSPSSATPLTGLVGLWVRVLITDGTGSINIGGTTYSALWHGIIDAESITDNGGGNGSQSWICAGIAAHLGRVNLTAAWSLAYDYTGAASAWPTTRVPTFNAPDSTGLISSSSTTIDGTAGQGLFDNLAGTPWGITANKWSAKYALEMLLLQHGRYQSPSTAAWAGGLSWALSAGTLLDWDMPATDLNGMTMLDAVNAIINQRRGLIWRVTVSGAVATIYVMSIAAASITQGSFTLAAATNTATPNLTAIDAANVNLLEDQTNTYDVIRVIGERPWVGITIAYDPNGPPAEVGGLQKGWTTTQETTWDTAPDKTTDGVWRSFRLGLKFGGAGYAGAGLTGLRQKLTVSGEDYTGARTFSTTEYGPISLVDLLPELPCGEGITSSPAGPRQNAMAFWKAAGQTEWTDLQQSDILGRNLNISKCPGAIHLGTPDRKSIKSGSEQQENKFNLESTGVLAVTLGMREPDPLIVSWSRSSASWPRSNPRVLVYSMPSAEQWVLLKDTVIGISAGALVKNGADTVIRDDVPEMQSTLAFLRAYYSEPSRSLSWSTIGYIDFSYLSVDAAPGALVTTATLGIGARTINAVVTRRTWNLTSEGIGTSYTTSRIIPDLEAIR